MYKTSLIMILFAAAPEIMNESTDMTYTRTLIDSHD